MRGDQPAHDACHPAAFGLPNNRVKGSWSWVSLLVVSFGLGPLTARGQIDPVARDLVQLGYNAPLEGRPPLAGYAFLYHNQPDFLATNLTLRLAVAPVYLDAELGLVGLLGENTDLGIDLAGGGFSDSYMEIREGSFLSRESFYGNTVEGGLSVYHLFNPGQLIPLNGLVRVLGHASFYDTMEDTASDFRLPPDHTTLSVRAGLRWGGREPTLFPDLAMELSAWYEGFFRSADGSYGTVSDPKTLRPDSHLFWGEAFLAYTLPESHHRFEIGLTLGTSLDTDRFSAYRLGGFLPLASEFPLSLPGYYYQELSARQFLLMSLGYILPLDAKQRWNLAFSAASAFVDYLPGLEQPGHWNTGVGAGLLYKTNWSKIMLGYAYGVDAIRSDGRGAQSIGIWMQFDLLSARNNFLNPGNPGYWRGLGQFFGRFGS